MALGAGIAALGGWTRGDVFCRCASQEEMVAQGGTGTHLTSSLFQIGQANQLCFLAKEFIPFLPAPLKTPLSITFSILPWINLPLFPLIGAISDQIPYVQFARFCNHTLPSYCTLPPRVAERINTYTTPFFEAHPKLAVQCSRWSWSCRLPTSVSPKMYAFAHFIAKHFSKLALLAMVTGAVALIALGNYGFGIAMLVAFTYHLIDKKLGLLPPNVSLFLEKYLPIVSVIGSLLFDPFVGKIFALIWLITFFPPAYNFILHKLDAWIHHLTKSPTPKLEDLEKPFQVADPNAFTYADIKEMLEQTGGWNDFEFTPAHFTHSPLSLSRLPKDKKFDKLLTLFDKVDWVRATSYPILLTRLTDDERFREFLKESFPDRNFEVNTEATREERERRKQLVEQSIVDLAAKGGITKEQYLFTWVREQLKNLVEVLKGNRKPKGTEFDRADAIDLVSIILHHLQKLNPATDRIEIESTLLALAVEGGNYCSRGIKRVALEKAREILLSNRKEAEKTPQADFAFKVLQQLENVRHRIVHQIYEEIVKTIVLKGMYHLPDQTVNDVHTYDIYRLALTLGFLPFTTHERGNLDVGSFIIFEAWFQIHHLMQIQYQDLCLDAFEDLNISLSDILRQLVQGNPNITAEDKADFEERLYEAADSESAWDRCKMLYLLLIGVIRRKEKAPPLPAPETDAPNLLANHPVRWGGARATA